MFQSTWKLNSGLCLYILLRELWKQNIMLKIRGKHYHESEKPWTTPKQKQTSTMTEGAGLAQAV
jgi:hypothetical protein